MADKRTLRQVTDTHKKAQIVVAQATGVGEMELVQRLLDGELSADEFIAQSVELNKIGHEQAVRLAEMYVRDVRGLIAPELVELPTVGVSFDYGQSAARAIATVKATERAQQETTRRASVFLESLRADAGENARRLLDSGSLTAAQARRLKQTFRKWTAASVQNAHRDTVIRSAEAVESGWRVVTDGNPCSFCAMLASYGEDVKGARAWPSHYFHPDCGCTIQEVPFGVDVEWTDRELELIRLREAAEKYVGTSDRKGMIAYMRAHGQGVVHDATIPEDERKKAGRPKKNSSGEKKPKNRVGSAPRQSEAGKLLFRCINDYLSPKSALPVKKLQRTLSEEEIIARVGGLDRTEGSCVSVALAYVGNKAGLDVLDFRGGRSRKLFSEYYTVQTISQLDGVVSKTVRGYNEIKTAASILADNLVEGNQYILLAGRHASVVKKEGENFYFLELQDRPENNGWKNLTDEKLKSRFRCKKAVKCFGIKADAPVTLIDIDSLKGNGDFQAALEYINTSSGKVLTGEDGSVK